MLGFEIGAMISFSTWEDALSYHDAVMEGCNDANISIRQGVIVDAMDPLGSFSVLSSGEIFEVPHFLIRQ
jgi:hypothetical protein